MRNFRLTAVAFILCTLPAFLHAQPSIPTVPETAVPPNRDLNIRVTDDQQQALDFATISLLNKNDSTQVLSTRSDSTGFALLQNIPNGTYLLCVTRVNYQQSCQQVEIPARTNSAGSGSASNPNSFHIKLSRSADLQNITVTGKKPAVQYAPDRTIINVDATISNAGATALEVLERSPGVTIDRDGNISLKGRNQVMVMIDNKPSYLSGAELANLLSGMSSNQIETIELIDNPSAKYDAAGNGGIINIRLKKNRQKGFNGNLSLSAGQGRYFKTNNSLGLNYRTGKFNVFANYSLNSNEGFMDMYALRTYLSNDDKTVLSLLEQPTGFVSKGTNQSLRTGVDYALSPNTDLGVVFSGTMIDRHGRGTGQAIWMQADRTIDSLIDTRSQSQTDWKNGAANFNFRHKFSARQELTADLDWVGYTIQGDQAFQNIRKGNEAYTESYIGELPSTIRIFSFKADHSLELNKTAKLETGVKISNTKTDNDAAYFLDQGAGWEPDLSKTNHFLYDENIQAVYASVDKKMDRWSAQLGLRYEHTSYTGEQLGNSSQKDSAFTNKYGSLFPTLMASYKIDSINEISITIGRRIDRPPYQKLNPFVSIVNKYTYMVGNPLMKPQYTNNIEISHRFKDFLSTGISYSVTNDYFSQIFYSDTSGTVYYTEGNLGKRQIWGLSVGFNKTIVPAWTFNTQIDLVHKKMHGFVWKEMDASITQMTVSMNNQFRFGKLWSAELSGYYITESQNDIQEVIEPTGQLSIGFARQVLKTKGNLKLSLRDIFWTQDMEGLTQFNHATEYFKLVRDSRVVTLAFTYRFGKGLKPMTKKRSSVDEMERVSN